MVMATALCGALLYCGLYLRSDSAEPGETSNYQVKIWGVETGEEEPQDPYEKDYLPVSVLAKCDNMAKELSLYVTEGICYAFLPAYTDLSELACVFDDTIYEVSLAGEKLNAGEKLQDIELGADYEIVIKERVLQRENLGQEELRYGMVFLRSQNLPAVFIDTQSGSMDYVDARKGNQESGEFCCVTAEGEIDSRSAMERIRGRGNTSWSGIDKKNQYNVSLTDSVDVLHMGSTHNYIVQANKLDVSMMRNKLAYDFARDIGIPYAVDAEFADMYFNGKYYGTYMVCEKVEVAESRIEAWDGYLLEENFRANDSETAFSTSGGNFVVNYPKDITKEQYDYIADYVSRTADSILLAEESDDYLNYIDLTSFARLFIVDEVGNDPDNNVLSTFYYKMDDTDETKLTAGPVWDFDIALGNDERSNETRNSYYSEAWFEYLYRSEVFHNEVAAQLREIMDNWYDKYENGYFENMMAYMDASYHMNEIRWEKRGYIVEFYPEQEETVQFLDNLFMTRLRNLNEVFNGSGTYYKVEFLDRGRQYAHTYVKDGEVIPQQVIRQLLAIDNIGFFSLTDESVIDVTSYVVEDDVRINCRPPEEGAGRLTAEMVYGSAGAAEESVETE